MGITFDGPTKVITLTAGTTTMSVLDLWSRWVDWWLTGDNSKYGIWMVNVGGNDIDITAGSKIPIYLFLDSSVKVKPQELDHTLAVTAGIILVAGGGDPFMDTTGNFTVRINYQQPVQAITISSGSGLSTEEHDHLVALDTDNVDIAKVNGTDVTGNGSAGTPWGPV